MLQESADVFRRFDRLHVQMHQPVAIVTEGLFEKIFVLCEQRRAVEAVQERNQVLIFDAGAGNFFADLPEGNSPLAQESALIVTNVLIEKIHASSA